MAAARIAVIIPALNEAAALPSLIAEIPQWVDRIIVADNGSTDATAMAAAAAGAEVVAAPRRGYGHACMAGVRAAADADILVFLDGDRSDYPTRMGDLITPIERGKADLVIGSRVLGRAERGALSPQQRYGNRLACALVHLFWGHRYTDLGPFRAIRRSSLLALEMREMRYGWTIEMQVAALRRGLAVTEVPVDVRRRIGVSKISGTIRGVISAGTRILLVIFREALRRR
jgi:glycosyltransferase involved in cell wall biosynthesis